MTLTASDVAAIDVSRIDTVFEITENTFEMASLTTPARLVLSAAAAALTAETSSEVTEPPPPPRGPSTEIRCDKLSIAACSPLTEAPVADALEVTAEMTLLVALAMDSVFDCAFDSTDTTWDSTE